MIMGHDATRHSTERNLARMYAQQALRAQRQQALALRAGDTRSASMLGHLAMHLCKQREVAESRGDAGTK